MTERSDAGETPLAAHLRDAVEKRLARLRENTEAALVTDSVDAVHDLRVASRRLRAFLDVFGANLTERHREQAARPLRRLTRAMGPLRDLDVQILSVEERRARTENEVARVALDHVVLGLHRQRGDARKRARKKLRRVDVPALEGAVRDALGDVLGSVPVTLVETSLLALSLVSPFLAAIERDLSEAPAGEEEPLHQVRIDAKRLRYAIELLEPAFGAAYRALHRQIEAVQETLGAHHDAWVLGRLVESELAALRGAGATALEAAMQRYRDALADDEKSALLAFRALHFSAGEYRARVEAALIGQG